MKKRSIIISKYGLNPEQIIMLKESTRCVYLSRITRKHGIHYPAFYSWSKGAKKPRAEHILYMRFCEYAFNIKL